VALHRARQTDAERLLREVGFAALRVNGRMRDELLNETLFLSLAHARVEIAAWVEDYNRERPHSAPGYATPAAFAAELNKQWPASLRPTGSATQPIASTALMRNKAAWL
jgi:putative transposase